MKEINIARTLVDKRKEKGIIVRYLRDSWNLNK